MASNVDQLASSIVRLKVGERNFDTRRSTLLNSGSPILARLIGGDDEGLRGADNDGDRIFVDGDGDGFAILLRALRSTRIDTVPERDRPQLALEADFYEVPWIRAALDPTNRYSPLAPTNRHAHNLAPEDVSIRDRAQNIRMALSDESDAAAARAAEDSLVDVFAAAIEFESDAQFRRPKVELLFGEKRRFASWRRQPLACQNIEGFRQRLDLFVGPLLEGLDMTNLVVAGGAVLRALLLKDTEDGEDGEAHQGSADVDLWIVAEDADVARETFKQVLTHVAAKLSEVEEETNDLLVVRSKYCVTVVGPWPARHVQIITRHYRNSAEILYNFDVDACQFAYDGTRVVATEAGYRALLTGVNVYDPERSSPHSLYEKRLLKYASNLGFAVAVPGLDLTRTKPYLLSGTYAFVTKARDARSAAWGEFTKARDKRQHLHGNLRHVRLTFSNDDVPRYVVDEEPITGLARLLVFAYKKEGSQASRDSEALMYLHGAPDDSGRGTFFIDLEALDNYGDEEVRRGRHPSQRYGEPPEVWKEVTPPAHPPWKLQLKLDENSYDAGTGLLPYASSISVGSVFSTLEALCHQHHQAPMRFCYNFVEDVRPSDILGHIPNVMDARLQDPRRFDLQDELPRYLSFPRAADMARDPSDAFARTPPADCFADVHL